MPRSILLAFLTTVLLAAVPADTRAQTDTAAIRKALGASASDYEATLRRQAPHRLMQAANCSETVGRYCVIYDAGVGGALPPEPERVKESRARAIEAFRKGVEAWPADSTLVGPLIRYLIEDGQAAEAMKVARSYAEQGADPAWANLLAGWAQHAAGDDASADANFARTLPRLLPNERVALHDVSSLLAPAEKTRYRSLTGSERARYHERLWRLADPLYLTDGNESLIEHFSRQIYGRILAYAPPDGAVGAWGPDMAELTVRFGVATARTQNFGTGMGGKRFTEHYDPNQLTYVPPALLTRNALSQFEPGSIWPYDTIRSRSGYAPRTVRRMLVLEHQVARFPSANAGELRADFLLPADSAVRPGARFQVGFFALDSTYQIIAAKVDTMMADNRSAGRISMPLPAGAAAYSLEAIELETRVAARARYLLPARNAARPLLSDVVILPATDAPLPTTRTGAEFQPLPTLVIPQGDAIALFLEARGLTADPRRQVRYRVDLEVLEQDSPGTFSRVARRLGRALGMGGDDVAPRITWNQQQDVAETTYIALKLGQIQLDPGIKQFRITLTDVQTGASATVERLLRISRSR